MPNFKVCKVYPRNGIQTISGILPKQEKIELPAKIKLNEKEVRRCMSFADVYEVVEKGDVLLTPVNYLADNSEAEVAKDVPKDELKDYTKTKEVKEDPSTPTPGESTTNPKPGSTDEGQDDKNTSSKNESSSIPTTPEHSNQEQQQADDDVEAVG